MALAAAGIQTRRLESVKVEYAQFQTGVKTLGELAAKAAKKREADDKLNKDKADAENKATVARLRADLKRLRDARPRGDLVPSAPTGSPSPERAHFDRALLERALRDFDSAVAQLAAEGDEARVNLDTAKKWADTQPENK